MKERLEDALSIASKVIRIAFYLGTSMYLAAKAIVIIPQSPDIPDWLLLPAILVCSISMVIISIKIVEEPSPRQLRSEREKAKKLESLLKFYKEDYK